MGRPITKKGIKEKELAQWTKAIKERDNYTCQICLRYLKDGPPQNCQAHHILDKVNFPHLRLDLMNGITLCYSNHKVGKYSAHLNPLFFAEWLKKNKPDVYYYLMEKGGISV